MTKNQSIQSNCLFTHGEDGNGRRFTIAAQIKESKEVRIGVSICSFQENFCKRKGRGIAINRANGRPTAIVDISDLETKEEVRKSAYEKMFEIKESMQEDAKKLWMRNQ